MLHLLTEKSSTWQSRKKSFSSKFYEDSIFCSELLVKLAPFEIVNNHKKKEKNVHNIFDFRNMVINSHQNYSSSSGITCLAMPAQHSGFCRSQRFCIIDRQLTRKNKNQWQQCFVYNLSLQRWENRRFRGSDIICLLREDKTSYILILFVWLDFCVLDK